MNIAYFLLPKEQVSVTYEDASLRQGLEKMRNWGYSAIPVLSRDNRYVGTISEGDFLWYIVETHMEEGNMQSVPVQNLEKVCIRDVLRIDRNPPVPITASVEELLVRAMNQNFIPVVDDRGIFIGLVTQQDIIRYFYYENTMKDAAEER